MIETVRLFIFKFTRLVFGLKPSLAVLGAVIVHHVNKYHSQYPELVSLIEDSLYVDDLVTGAGSKDEAFDVYLNCKHLMKEGGFNLRKWKSNSLTLMKRIETVEVGNDINTSSSTQGSKSMTTLTDIAADERFQLLGVYWDNHTDNLQFCFQELREFAMTLPLCKRSILRVSAGVFNPLGFLSPFVVRLKMLFQMLCTNKISWDEALEGNMLIQWKGILEEFVVLDQVTIPRLQTSGTSQCTIAQV